MQFINLIVQVIIPVSTVLIVQTQCDLKPFVHFEREREHARWFTCAVCEIVSQKVFKLLYKLFNEEIWIVPHLQHYNYFTHAEQRPRRCHCMSYQTSDGRRVISLRSAFIETADQTFQSDYRPIVIGSRSIAAPLVKSGGLEPRVKNSVKRFMFNVSCNFSVIICELYWQFLSEKNSSPNIFQCRDFHFFQHSSYQDVYSQSPVVSLVRLKDFCCSFDWVCRLKSWEEPRAVCWNSLLHVPMQRLF